jgi:hypothetical protein
MRDTLFAPVTFSIHNVEFDSIYVFSFRTLFRLLLPANEEDDYNAGRDNLSSDEKLPFKSKAIAMMREGLKSFDCWEISEKKNKSKHALVYTLAAMTYVTFMNQLQNERLMIAPHKIRVKYISDFPRGSANQQAWIDAKMQEVSFHLSSVNGNEECCQVLDWVYLNLLTLQLVLHESDASTAHLRYNFKLSLGDRYEDVSRSDIAELLCEAVQHIECHYTKWIMSNHATDGFDETDLDELLCELVGDDVGWDENVQTNLMDSMASHTNIMDSMASHTNIMDSASNLDTTDGESHTSDDTCCTRDTLKKAKDLFYSDYYFWIESMLHIEVLHAERIRLLQDKLKKQENKQEQQQMESAHKRLFTDKIVMQDREFIMKHFMIYYTK